MHLLCVFSKSFDKAMYQRFYFFLCKSKPSSTNNFGFRLNYATDDALISLIKTIGKSLDDDDEIVCGIFIDLHQSY